MNTQHQQKKSSSFCERIYEISRQIPKGKVATYKQLAKLSGNEKAARGVGVCMRINPDVPRTPCHRVVASDGSLTGYSAAAGLFTKRELLLSEGVSFVGDKVDLEKSLWQAE